MVWQCPKCQLALSENGRSLSCPSGHNFDRARQGYLYLLLANQKSSRVPGDSEEMIIARRDFLRAGHYQLLPQTITRMLLTGLLQKPEGYGCLLDLGCGEGYYTEEIGSTLLSAYRENCMSENQTLSCFGVDLSKSALRKASVSARKVSAEANGALLFDYAVCSTYQLPVADCSVDIALNIFAPLSVAETVRVLKPGGFLVRVQPGPRHLFQLKALLYETPELHTFADIESEFDMIERQRLQYPLHLMHTLDIQNLLTMTPLFYSGSRDAKRQLMQTNELMVDIDFDVQLLRTKPQ